MKTNKKNIDTVYYDYERNFEVESASQNCDLRRDLPYIFSLAAEEAHRSSICSSGGKSLLFARLRNRLEIMGDECLELIEGVLEGSPDQTTRLMNALVAASNIINARNKALEVCIDQLIDQLFVQPRQPKY